ncbi:MAG: AEC family transporter [Proteobacteria bacterium]|nr:AEC family transporter [Pseudomonadota bacterium]
MGDDPALILRVADVLVPVFALVALGYFYARRFSADIRIANELNMRLFVPALVFDSLTQKNFDIATHPWLLLAGVMVIFGSGLLSWPVARISKNSIASFVPPMMFNNCGNMGLPVALLAFGETGLQLALILFMVSNMLHFTLGVRIVSGRMHFAEVFFNAVNVATVIALLFSVQKIAIPEIASVPIGMAGQVAIPLMLVSLGIRMTGFNKSMLSVGLLAGFVRPAVGIVSALIAISILPLDNFEQKMLILFAAMPPAVLNYLFAEQYGQSPQAVASIVIVGNAVSVLVLYLVLMLIL